MTVGISDRKLSLLSKVEAQEQALPRDTVTLPTGDATIPSSLGIFQMRICCKEKTIHTDSLVLLF